MQQSSAAARQVTIRTAHEGDIPNLMQIRAQVVENRLTRPDRVPASSYAEFMAISHIWLFEDEDRIWGFSAADPRDGTIWALFVHPAAEGRGLAKRLLAKALDDLRAADWIFARLYTEPWSRADIFYRYQGWTPDGLTEDGEQCFFLRL